MSRQKIEMSATELVSMLDDAAQFQTELRRLKDVEAAEGAILETRHKLIRKVLEYATSWTPKNATTAELESLLSLAASCLRIRMANLVSEFSIKYGITISGVSL